MNLAQQNLGSPNIIESEMDYMKQQVMYQNAQTIR